MTRLQILLTWLAVLTVGLAWVAAAAYCIGHFCFHVW